MWNGAGAVGDAVPAGDRPLADGCQPAPATAVLLAVSVLNQGACVHMCAVNLGLNLSGWSLLLCEASLGSAAHTLGMRQCGNCTVSAQKKRPVLVATRWCTLFGPKKGTHLSSIHPQQRTAWHPSLPRCLFTNHLPGTPCVFTPRMQVQSLCDVSTIHRLTL